MPFNKDALSRFRWIDERLRNKRLPKPTLANIIEYVSDKIEKPVGERTIQQDIQHMRSDTNLNYFAPIVYDRSSRTYSYSDDSYSINQIPIDEADLEGLEIAIGILEQFRSLPVVQQFEDAILKIATSLKINRDSLENQGLIRFSKATQFKGTEFIPEIIDAIKNREVIRLAYQSFGRTEPKEHWVEPYHLREYQDRFYLVGKSQKSKNASVLTFGLDRIIKIWPTNLQFDEKNFDDASYFRHAIGITVSDDQAPKKIIISLSPLQGKYVKSQPIHNTQKVLIDNGEECRVSIEVVINTELIMLLLSYGKNAKVLEPRSLAQRLAEEAGAVLHLYKDND